MKLGRSIILASQSPRRKLLLQQLGLTFTTRISNVDEIVPTGTAPAEAVEEVALRKAQAVSRNFPGYITIGADTIVVLDGTVLGKPRDESEATAMLKRLAGNTHEVYTGMAFCCPQKEITVTTHERTRVTFSALTENEIQAYVRTGSPMDKAGAYGIQDDLGAIFVSRIAGDYYNVVGLPLHCLYTILKSYFGDELEL